MHQEYISILRPIGMHWRDRVKDSGQFIREEESALIVGAGNISRLLVFISYATDCHDGDKEQQERDPSNHSQPHFSAAMFEPASSSIISSSILATDHAPIIRRPLMNDVGVPATPSLFPVSVS